MVGHQLCGIPAHRRRRCSKPGQKIHVVQPPSAQREPTPVRYPSVSNTLAISAGHIPRANGRIKCFFEVCTGTNSLLKSPIGASRGCDPFVALFPISRIGPLWTIAGIVPPGHLLGGSARAMASSFRHQNSASWVCSCVLYPASCHRRSRLAAFRAASSRSSTSSASPIDPLAR